MQIVCRFLAIIYLRLYRRRVITVMFFWNHIFSSKLELCLKYLVEGLVLVDPCVLV